MAIDLKTKLTTAFAVQELLSKTKFALAKILNQDHQFQIKIGVEDESIHLNENRNLLVHTNEFPVEFVELNIIYSEAIAGYEDPNEDGWWAYVTIRAANQAPMKYALAASVILSLAEINNSQIWDENLAWTKNEVLTNDVFLDLIKVKKQNNNQEGALLQFMEDLYNRVNT